MCEHIAMQTIRGRIATTHVHFNLAVYQVVTITVCEVVFVVAIGSYRGRKVVRRAASCVRFDSDVFKFETSRDTFQVCTGVMPIAKNTWHAVMHLS